MSSELIVVLAGMLTAFCGGLLSWWGRPYDFGKGLQDMKPDVGVAHPVKCGYCGRYRCGCGAEDYHA